MALVGFFRVKYTPPGAPGQQGPSCGFSGVGALLPAGGSRAVRRDPAPAPALGLGPGPGPGPGLGSFPGPGPGLGPGPWAATALPSLARPRACRWGEKHRGELLRGKHERAFAGLEAR